MAEYLTAQDQLTPSTRKKRANLPSWRAVLFIWLPSIVVAGVVLLPIIYLLIRGLQAEAQFTQLITSPSAIKALGNTLILAFSVTLASIVIAVPLAWLTTRTDLPGKRIWAILTALPLVIPSYVGAYLLVSTLGPRGMAQQWLEGWLGVDRLPEIYGFPGALYLLTILSYPFILLSVRAALQRLDPSLEEAAQSLGFGAVKTFWKVTLPQLRPAVAAGSLLVTLYVLRDFGAVSILRYDTFTRIIYIQYNSSFNRSSAAALALMLAFTTLLILLIESWSRGQAKYYTGATNPARPPVIVPLGKWKAPAVIFCSLVVLAAVIMPAMNLGFWLWRGAQAGEQVTALWAATQNSILAAALAALATIVAALPVAVISVRYPGKISKTIEQISYMAFALPGIVIALALVFFGVRYVRPLYQTLAMLIGAYGILFLPEAVGAIRSSLLQIHPSMEEAARSLGHHSPNVFRKVILPLVRPGIAAGGSLVFLTTMKELPATLILSPIGFKTLATSIWGAVSEAFFAQAAAPALIIILVSSVPMAIITIRENLK